MTRTIRSLDLTATLRCLILFCISSALLLIWAPAQAAEWRLGAGATPTSRSERKVGPGVTHIREHYAEGPMAVNILKVELTHPYVRVETEQSRDRMFAGETVAAMAARESAPGAVVVGAVNGDFWSNEPRPFRMIGLSVSDGMIYSMPHFRTVFAMVRDAAPYIGPVTMSVSVEADGNIVAVTGINDPVSTRGVQLYTPRYQGAYPKASARRLTLRLDAPEFLPNQPVSATVVGEAPVADSPPASGTLLLCIHRDAAESAKVLKRGARVVVKAVVPEVNGVIEYCLGGGPRLVREGRVSNEWEAEKMGKSFSETRHPRTAVGVSKDGRTVYLVTIDGRQPLISVGVSLDELADYMAGLGCHHAVNLDGGGSTTMIVRGRTVNSPSDRGGLRPVTNGILVLNTAPPGPLHTIEIVPEGRPVRVPLGAAVDFVAVGYDENYSEVGFAGHTLSWSTTGSPGTIRGQGERARFVAARQPSAGVVRLQTNRGPAAEVPIESVRLDSLTVEPNPVVLSSGESEVLTIRAETATGPLELVPAMVSVKVSDSIVSASVRTVEGRRKGRTWLTVSAGDFSTTVPCFVDEYRSVSIENFDDAARLTPLSGVNFDTSATRIAAEARDRREGSGALKLDYAMLKGGTTKIAVPVNAVITEKPSKLALWIRGDGREAWVRGELVDAEGQSFLVDFTDGSKGVYWNDTWRRVYVPMRTVTPKASGRRSVPRFPATLKELYIAQTQEALKGRGSLVFDGLEALYPPMP
ncbi:MAG: phosphodiester glycosidase family protein [Candidatus Sumerlaeaceae bacterium]|nr:phosphodiester glycosidase family protein [Candidatus Sumerlaeaceae bacterium]